jgi:hypothetical protein
MVTSNLSLALCTNTCFNNQDLDSPRSNLRTVEYLNATAGNEGPDL